MKLKFKNVTTEELIKKAQDNDLEALEELVRREEKNIFATLYYMNARCDEVSDLTQEILLKVAKNIKKLKEIRIQILQKREKILSFISINRKCNRY